MHKPRLMTDNERLKRLHYLADQNQAQLLKGALLRTLLFTVLVVLIRLLFGAGQSVTFEKYLGSVAILTPFVFVVFYLFNLLERYIMKRKVGKV